MTAAAAGLAAAACIAVPTVLPASAPGSADQAAAVQALHRLARIAAASPVDHMGATQFLHTIDVGHQAASGGQAASGYRYEYWTRTDGLTYQRRDEQYGDLPARRAVWLTAPGPVTIDGMTSPVYLDRLPTEPSKLRDYIAEHTTGSTSRDERVFVAVVDVVRRGLAPSALRSACIDVLTELGHVRLGAQGHDSLGRPTEAFMFVDNRERPGDVRTIMFDTRTAQITEERETKDGTTFVTDAVTVFEVVDSVPADVREHAVLQR